MIEKETTPVFTDTDQLHFESHFRKGTYQIDIIPSQLFYTLTPPSGEITTGSLPALLSTTVEYGHTQPDVNLWLKGIIDSVMNTYKDTEPLQTKKFSIGGRQYSISFNDLGVSLHFPETFIVCSRSNLSNHFPEVLSIKQGAFSTLLGSTLADSNIIPDDNDSPQQGGLPQYCDQMNYYRIEDLSCGIGYNPVTEVFFLSFDARTVKTHISALALDAWEYSTLHHGEYKKVVDRILFDYGLVVH